MSERRRPSDLHVVGLGARTPVGLRAAPSAAAVRAGVSRLREHPFMVDKTGDPFRGAMDDLIEDHHRVGRMLALAASALDEVVEGLGVKPSARVAVFLGLPELGAHFTALDARDLCGQLAERLSPRCQAQIQAIPQGNAAAVTAFQQAAARIQADPSALCVVGGVDSFFDPDLLEPLDRASRIASTSNRWGFPPGEGAAMLAVCSRALARQERWPSLAAIASVATAEEPNRIHTKSICLGVGLARAMGEALGGAGGPITRQYCDLDGERYREHELSYALLRLPAAAFVDALDYVAPVDCWGHTGAATAALLALLPIAHHQRGASPGTRPMIWCGSDNGLRGALVLHLDDRVERRD